MSIRQIAAAVSSLTGSARHTNTFGYPAEKAVNTGATQWVRNPSWLTLPTVLPSEQKIVALFAVFPEQSSVAFTISGAYTVDWGDGSATQNLGTGVQANKDYSFSSSALNNTNAPVTFTASTSTVNRNNHGYTNGMTVQFYNIVTTTGIASGQPYYVVNATTNTFQVSDTFGGSALSLTGDGSATLLPYKQAIITITPQAGQNLNGLAFNVIPASKFNLNGVYSTNFLDIVFSAPNATSFQFASSTPNVRFGLLEQAQWISTSNSITSWNNAFNGCINLQSVPQWNIRTSGAVTTQAMFQNCWRMQTAPSLNLSAVTDVTNMFANCASLVNVPDLNIGANTTTFNSMFLACTSLVNAPYINMIGATNTTSMFTSCNSLTYVPNYNMPNASTITSMFSNCWSLVTAPALRLGPALSISAASLFGNCYNLRNIPVTFDISRFVLASNLFSNCADLVSLPWQSISLPLATTTAGMFSGCGSLLSVPPITLGATNFTSMNTMFQNCYSLKTIGTITVAATGGFTVANTFENCTALQSVFINNTTSAITSIVSGFANCNSLTSVRFGSGGTALTVSGTAGFSSCFSLASIPPINVANIASGFNSPIGNSGQLRSGSVVGARYGYIVPIVPMDIPTYNNSFMYTVGQAIVIGSITLGITSNPQSGLTTLSASVVSAGNVLTVSSTSSLSVGMRLGTSLTSVGCGTITGVTGTVSTSTITSNSHGFNNGDKIAFSSIGTVTGISTYAVYYVVNATTNTLQLSLTSGGSVITFGGTDSSVMQLVYARTITQINNATTFTVNGPALPIAAATTYTFHTCDVDYPILRGWTISG